MQSSQIGDLKEDINEVGKKVEKRVTTESFDKFSAEIKDRLDRSRNTIIGISAILVPVAMYVLGRLTDGGVPG